VIEDVPFVFKLGARSPHGIEFGAELAGHRVNFS
jgi:hypothetical protein